MVSFASRHVSHNFSDKNHPSIYKNHTCGSKISEKPTLKTKPTGLQTQPAYAMLQIQTAPGRLRETKARAVVRPAARATPTYILQLLGGTNKRQRLTKNERGFCGEMETEMEKTMEQIENILERATLDQLKIILRFLRHIIK